MIPAEIEICDECESNFSRHSSKMNSLCPECANFLYGYENCSHELKNGVCSKCNWDDFTSTYVKNLKQNSKL